jgi:segregation and condensation protein B
MKSTGGEMKDENPIREEKDETIPLSHEQDAQFSGNTIYFPTRGGNQPSSEPQAPKTERAPIEDRSPGPRRSFLSFFDPPQPQADRPEGEPASERSDDANSQEADESEEEQLSFDEFAQNEEVEQIREDLDNLIRQNDADALFALGEQYGRVSESPLIDPLPDEEVSITPTSILEAILFVGNRENEPLRIDKAISVMRGVTEEDINLAVEELNTRYTHTGAPYRINQIAGGLKLELRPEFESVRDRFFSKVKEVTLSQKAIDILALIAYRQPITATEIFEIRPQSQSILNVLLKRELIETQNQENVDAPPLYRTTPRLLKILGIKSISDLPIVDELDYR